MKNNTFYAIGVMSGSSLDGLDLVYCKFVKDKKWSFEIIEETVVDINIWTEHLKKSRALSSSELNILDKNFGKFIGKSVNNFILENKISNVDIISSHGHTVYHFPKKGITKQIGLGEEIFKATQKPVLYNLRQKDIDLGGNGAPIVPIGDLHLFSEYKYCLNIGGITNISIKENNSIFAYDICSANQILNTLVHEKGFKYDDKGKIAKKGRLNKLLFDELNTIEFYKKAAPKSLDNSFSEKALEIIATYSICLEDKLCTYCHHIAHQIANNIVSKDKERMLITGGGSFNTFLIERISEYLNEKYIEVIVPSNEIVNNKEALIMAFMGVLYLRNEVNCLSSATGAKKDSICGEYYFG